MSAGADAEGYDDPLAGTARPLAALGEQARAMASALKKALSGADRAAGGADAIRGAAQADTAAVRGMKDSAAAAETSMGKAAMTAGTAAGGLRGALARIRGVSGSLGQLALGAGGALAMLVAMTPALAPVQNLLDKLGLAMMIGSLAITAVNTLIKANPIGFVTGVLAPLAAYLIDLALNSETGQRIMRKVADTVTRGIPAVLTVLGPLLKVVATVVATYFAVYLTVVVDVLKVVAAVVNGGFAVMRALLTGNVGSLRGIVSRAWQGLRNALSPVLNWLTRTLPGAFTRVKDAVSRALGAAGGFLTTGAQTVAGVAKAPLEGLIAFANWVISGLNKIGFSFFGKHFGIHLSPIPMLAEGGIVLPAAARGAARVLPLTALDRQLALAASLHRAGGTGCPHRVQEYRESAALGAHGTAEELLFLAAVHA
ncbi:hypothetical protein [Streptomyces sp. HPF1205]|uniref:hypothetical protein n=1 Tax=Streptomyces sp. HPF1205 TaxID=2873262 RepID=UPI001CEDCCED|nr:hypothetical protein [Streptomyces sp. HPF1205]